jgi:hypothetical protein
MNAIQLSDTVVNLSPKPVLSLIGKTTVVRDDLLPGGTKQRASGPFIQGLLEQGFNHFIYASPFSGFAQVALAYVCQMLDVKCTIVCERDQRFVEDKFHPFSMLAQNYGAKLVMVSSLSQAEDLAQSISIFQSRSHKIPLGFDCPEFRHHLNQAVVEAMEDIESRIGLVKNLWIPVGSGTLVRTFLSALPERIKLKCVNVRVLCLDDQRINFLQDHPRVDFYQAPMKFHDAADDFPPIPSNTFYDAKLWSFIKSHGQDRDIWWNVAR